MFCLFYIDTDEVPTQNTTFLGVQIFLNVLQAWTKYRCENLAAHRESHW